MGISTASAQRTATAFLNQQSNHCTHLSHMEIHQPVTQSFFTQWLTCNLPIGFTQALNKTITVT